MSDRIDTLLGLLLAELDELEGSASSQTLSARVGLRRAHAIRAFQARFGESPSALGRRLRLERAAWTLKATTQSVTAVALDAGYNSLEGFTRAFARAYGISPSLYRRTGLRPYLLPARSGIHHQPTGQPHHTEVFMDILTHLLSFDEAFVRQAIAQAHTLPERSLDQPLGETQPQGFELPDRTLRDVLDKLILNKEVWVAAVRGAVMPPEDRGRSLDELEARLNVAFPAFAAIASEIQAESRWQQTFVDALCEPSEIFPYGGMLAHVLSVDAHRRHVLSAWFWRLGVRLDADPMHFGQQFKTELRHPSLLKRA